MLQVQEVMDEIDRLLALLPNYVRHYSIKTNVKKLSENEHKVIQDTPKLSYFCVLNIVKVHIVWLLCVFRN